MMELLNEFLSGSVAWGVLLTLAAFALGALVNRVTGKAFFNPLLLGAIFVIVFLSVCGIPYADYKVSAAPVNYLLLPATVALAIPLYEKLDLLKANAAAIIAGISVGTLDAVTRLVYHVNDNRIFAGFGNHDVGSTRRNEVLVGVFYDIIYFKSRAVRNVIGSLEVRSESLADFHVDRLAFVGQNEYGGFDVYDGNDSEQGRRFFSRAVGVVIYDGILTEFTEREPDFVIEIGNAVQRPAVYVFYRITVFIDGYRKIFVRRRR